MAFQWRVMLVGDTPMLSFFSTERDTVMSGEVACELQQFILENFGDCT